MKVGRNTLYLFKYGRPNEKVFPAIALGSSFLVDRSITFTVMCLIIFLYFREMIAV